MRMFKFADDDNGSDDDEMPLLLPVCDCDFVLLIFNYDVVIVKGKLSCENAAVCQAKREKSFLKRENLAQELLL